MHLANRLSYSSKNFYVHEGVSECLSGAITALTGKDFSLCFITGSPRFGKTHLSIKISDILVEKKFLPRLIEGDDFREWLSNQAPRMTFTHLDRIIIDDADKYLKGINRGYSGPLVNLIETLRSVGAGVVFLSRTDISELPCDEHIKSRLIPGGGYKLLVPGESDTETLTRLMAEQRGIMLKERKLEFIVRRLRKDIPSIENYFERVGHLSQVLGQRIRFTLLGDAVEKAGN